MLVKENFLTIKFEKYPTTHISNRFDTKVLHFCTFENY